MNFKLFSALALLSIVAAQSDPAASMGDSTGTATMPNPSGGPGPTIPACVQTCIGQSGCDATDVTCLCTTGLQTITSCVTSTCSPEEQDAAASLQEGLCSTGGTSMSGGMNSTMVTGSATTQGVNSTSSTASSSGVVSLTMTTQPPTLTPRPLSSSSPTTSATSAGAATSTNAAVSQNIVAQGVWVMVASLIGVAVAA